MNYKAESLNRLAFPLKFGDRPCRIYGEAHAEYLLLQMTGEHELQSMESEATAIAPVSYTHLEYGRIVANSIPSFFNSSLLLSFFV